MQASVIQFRAYFAKALRAYGYTDVYGSVGCRGRFIAISVGVELGSHPAKNVELNAANVGRLRCSGLVNVRAFLNEEVSALLASLFPTFVEPRCASAPVV